MLRLLIIASIATLSAGIQAELVPNASSFRVTTKIFSGNEAEPSAVHLILFEQGMIYDLPQIEPRFVTVLDVARQRVILLDRQTKVRSTITTDSLLKITAQARAAATDPKMQQQLGLLAQVETSSDGSLYSIRYGDIEYQTKSQSPSRKAIAGQFGQFTDWAARLNLVRRLGLPPFARMTLNDRMSDDGKLPRETSLSMRRGLKTDHYRSTHDLIEQLSVDDRKLINEVGGMLALYTEVDIDAFPK